jgi:hypothetical protein
MGLAVPGRLIQYLIAEDRSADGVRDRTRPGTSWSPVWSTFGPHAIGTKRFATVASGTSWCRSQLRSCGDEPRCRTLIRMRSQVKSWQAHHPSPQVTALLATSWERWLPAWAALGPHPHPASKPSAFPGSAHPGVRLHDHHPAWSPTQPRTAAARQARPPRAAASHWRSARRPACLVPQPVTRGRRLPLPLPGPVRIRHQPTLTNARPASVARVHAPSAVDRAARRRGSPPGLDPFRW